MNSQHGPSGPISTIENYAARVNAVTQHVMAEYAHAGLCDAVLQDAITVGGRHGFGDRLYPGLRCAGLIGWAYLRQQLLK